VRDIVLDDLAQPSFDVDSPWGTTSVHLAVSGRHMALNAAAALAAAGSLGVAIGAAAAALADTHLSPSRMAVHRLSSGGVLIDDAYNANPTSMAASLDALAAIPATRRIAVLGVMAELDDPAAGHRAIAEQAARLGIELIAVGTDRYGVTPVADPVAAVGRISAGTAVVVKASLVGGLQAVAAELLARHQR
jgi:UDP-N-acetylmuramoyl-tripeptide--D-alanyl-D-alanine ligase